MSAVEAANLPLLHRDQAQPAVAERLGAVRRRRPRISSSKTSGACGPPTSSTTSASRSQDYLFSNGVVGKLVTYDMEERQRIKIVDYTGSKQLESTKIDEKLKEENVTIRLDSFVDDAIIRRVKTIVRGMLSEKGYLDSKVTHRDQADWPAAPRLVNLMFTIDEGPKYKIRKIDFVGNKAIGDGTLQAEDEGDEGAVVPLLHHRPRHLQGRQVRRGRREGRRPLPRRGLPARAGRQPRGPDARGLEGQEDALRRAAHPGHRGAALQGRRGRRSPTTRWSSPRRSSRSSA